MWSSSVDQDLAWMRSGSESYPKHNRIGPYWSWTQADDGHIFWWSVTGDDQYFRLLEITELGSTTDDQVHQSPLTALVLSSELLPISPQLLTESPSQGQISSHFEISRILEHPEHSRVSLQYNHSPVMLAGDSDEDIDQDFITILVQTMGLEVSGQIEGPGFLKQSFQIGTKTLFSCRWGHPRLLSWKMT